MSHDVAIFIDLDNIAIGAQQANLAFDIELVLEHIVALTNGRIVLRQAFGAGENVAIIKAMSKAGFSVQASARINHFSKNLADMQITVSAMETLLNHPQLHTYVLMSGDRDFSPLVQALRKQGKRVIGVGLRHTTSESLAALCDNYIYYEDLAPQREVSPTEAGDLLEAALEDVLQNKNRVRASILKQTMVEMSGNAFDRGSYGAPTFRRFLERFPEIVEVEQEGTTIYVRQPRPEPTETPLYMVYRRELKKRRLRVVGPRERFHILKLLLNVVKTESLMPWREVLDQVSLASANGNGRATHSRNKINDVMQIARHANVIATVKGFALADAPVQLLLTGERLFTEAVARCDTVYLQAIQELEEPFVIEAVALALYDKVEYVPYLQSLMKVLASGKIRYPRSTISR